MGRHTCAIALAVVGLTAVSRAQTVPTEVDRAVRANLAEYCAAWLAGDAARVMATLTGDAVLLPSGRAPLVGEAAIRGFWFPPAGPPTTVLALSLDVERVEGSADVAYAWGRGSLTFSYPRDGRETTVTAVSTFVNVLRRESGGAWRTALRMWNDLPPPR
ncbi:MAG: DUF4440 domain-containing protein [Vicinamibacterales bacterium]